MTELEQKFCEVFAQLFRDEWNRGNRDPKIKRRAALAAGYGESSWSRRNQLTAAELAATRNLKKPQCRQYIEEMGLSYDGTAWQIA